MSEPEHVPPLDYATPEIKLRVNALAIVALSISLIGLVVPFTGLIALACASVARRQLEAQPHQRGRGAAGMALVAGVIGTLVSAVIVWVYCDGIATQRLLRCNHQMRAIGDCLHLYMAEQRGQFPPSLAALSHQTAISGTGLYVCPSSSSVGVSAALTDDVAARAAWHIDYIYTGEGLTIRSPKGELVLIERFSDHGRMVNVLYADGAVESLTRSAALKLLEPLRNTPRLTDEEYDAIVGK